jgi:RNA-directed DNA polymerase
VEEKGIAMLLITPERIRTLQRKLYIKAKQEPAYRFYAFYDKLYHRRIYSIMPGD